MNAFRRSIVFFVISAALVLPPGAEAKPGKSAVPGKSTEPVLSGQSGWCCEGCEVSRDTRASCLDKGGRFFLTMAAARGECDSQKKWCCVGGSLIGATREECDRKKGTFFCDEGEGKKKCVPSSVQVPVKKGKAGPAAAALAEQPLMKAGKGPVSAKKITPGAGPKGWCSSSGGVMQLTEALCAEKKGILFAEKSKALSHSLSLKKPKATFAKPETAGTMKVRTGMTGAVKVPEAGVKAGPVKFGAHIPRVSEGEARGAMAAPGPARGAGPGTSRRLGAGGQSSSLAQRILIMSPGDGDVFDWGGTITVHYRVLLLDEEPGMVTFSLRDPEYRTIATTTHYYDAPVLDPESEIESIEPATDVGYVELEGDGGPAEGPGVFQWTLPGTGGHLGGYGFTIVAEKGPHIGVSDRFTMLRDCTHGDMSVAIEPPQAVLRRGEAVTVSFAFCSWGGLAAPERPVYLHDSASSMDDMGTWEEPGYSVIEISEDRVRGALRVTVPSDYPTGGPNVFTLFYEGGRVDTPAFEVAAAMGNNDFELTDLFRNSAGEIIARVWVGDSLGGTALAIQANDRIVTATVEAGENDIVVGTMTVYSGGPSLGTGPYTECAEEWNVIVNPGGSIEESNGVNNRLTRVFSNYENAGLVWLWAGDDLYNTTRAIDCGCFDGSPMESCDTAVFLKNCSSSAVEDVDSVITVTHYGRRLPEGELAWEDFSEPAPFEVAIGPALLPETVLPVGEYAKITVRWEGYRARSDSTLSFSFGHPVSGWTGITNPFEVNLDFCSR